MEQGVLSFRPYSYIHLLVGKYSSITFFSSSICLFIFRGLEDEAKKAMLRLRGPNYLMNAELEELKTILASEKQFSELAYASKYKELGSKKVLLPVATLLVMFSLQVNNGYFFWEEVSGHE